MNYPFSYPHTIENIAGEQLTFERIEIEDGEPKMIVTNLVQPECGPPMHVHFKQDESLTVVKGKMGYQLMGGDEMFVNEGESVIFKRNTPHRFWNAADIPLECTGWIKPANTVDYFLSGLYESMNKAGKPEGDPFDGAFLITRYKTEYDVFVIPTFVKKVIMPITVVFGRLLGKYKHFANAPEAIK